MAGRIIYQEALRGVGYGLYFKGTHSRYEYALLTARNIKHGRRIGWIPLGINRNLGLRGEV